MEAPTATPEPPPEPVGPAAPWWLRLWVGAVFLAFAAGCLHEAFGPFLLNHDGYNGSAFAQAARNALRFGVLEQAQYYTGATPPPLSEVYTNHPMMLHLHLIGLFAGLGVEPWVGRLVPVLYALAFLVLLHRVAARRVSPVAGALAITLWTITPLHTIFANMINHEQGGLFWGLLLVDRYAAFVEARRDGAVGAGRAREWPIHLAVTLAMQFDWPGYYLAFFIGLHALGEVWRPGPSPRPLLARAAFLLRFSATVLLNAAAFFGWIAWLRGGLSAMGDAFALRTAKVGGYGALLWERSLDLYGAGLLALLAAWTLWLCWRLLRTFVGLRTRFVRARRRAPAHPLLPRTTLADFIPACFLLAQAIHSTVFKAAGAIHAYWTFYAGPALALGGASLLVAVGRWLLASGRGRTWRLGVTALSLCLFAQAWFALYQHHWGYDALRAAYLPLDTDEEWLDVHWAMALHERHGREGTCYLIHPSAERRVHLSFYLDAPRAEGIEVAPGAVGPVGTRSIGAMPRPPVCRGRQRIALFDLQKMPWHRIHALWELARGRAASLWAGRFVSVALDLPTPAGGPDVEAWAWVPEVPEPGWSWLVNSRHAPGSWQRDPGADRWLTRDGLPPARWAGGRGGRPRALVCPPGTAVKTLAVKIREQVVAGWDLTCSLGPGGARSSRSSRSVGPGGTRSGGPAGPADDAASHCPPGTVPAGVLGRAGALVDALGLACRVLEPGGRALGPSRDGTLLGGSGGTPFRLACDEGHVLTGLDTRTGARLNAVRPMCTPLGAFFPRAAPIGHPQGANGPPDQR